MRITIVPEDGAVSVNGVGVSGIDMTSVDSTIHAVQWYETTGEIERKDETGRIVSNETITSMDQFSTVIGLYNDAIAAAEAAEAALREVETVIEV